MNQQYLRDAPLGDNETTAVAVVSDFPGVIDLILELLPQTKQVFVVVGSGKAARSGVESSRRGSCDFRIA